MKISEISIKRPSVIIVLFSLMLLGGIASYFGMGYELVPKFDVNVISVQTVYPGAAPEEVETSVTKVIEDAVSSLENVKKIESKSMESVSVVIVTLNTGADVNFLLTDAQRKINAVVNDLPDDAETPSLNKFSLDDVPIMNLSVTSDLTEKELYDLLDQKIQPIFSRINGVAKVDLIGGEEREIQVSIDPERMDGYGLTINQVQQIIAASNMDFPTGNIKSRNNQMTIRLSGKFTSLEQMRNLPITTPAGTQIRLRDIADVQDGIKDIEKIARIDQTNTILMQVFKQSDANAVAVSDLVKETIETIQVDYSSENVQVSIASDSTDYTINAANNVMVDLSLAVVLVVLIMLFFLHSLRDAGIASLAIPLSLIGTFIVLNLLGYTLNLMTLLGLSLVVGIVVDDAIVVIENIHRHMEMGKNKVRAAFDGAKEIGFTVTAITLVIVVVFLPIAMSSGLVADILRQFCVTVVVATLLSLVVSFTLVPWLYSRVGKLSHISRHSFFGKILYGFEAGLTKLTNFISGVLEWSLKKRANKIITLLVTVILFLASTVGLVGGGFIGGDFFPGNDRGEFYLQFELEKDASIEQTNLLTQRAEEILIQKPEIEKMITTVGQASDGMMSTSGTKYKSEIQIYMDDEYRKTEPTKVYAAKLKREMENLLVDAKVSTIQVGIMGAEQAPLMLTVIASSQEDALEYAQKAADILENIPGSSEVKLTSEDGNPEVVVQLDRDKMNTLGLNVATVGMTMQTAFAGNTDTKYRAGDTEYDINIRFDEIGRNTIEDVQNLKFINNQGHSITLQQFADVSYGSGPTLLERRDKSPSVSVQAQVVGKPAGTLAEEWEAEFSQLELKPGVAFRWGGNKENQDEGFGTLGIALLASIFLVYSVLVILYDSFSKPFIILLSIPLSFIGALLLLALTNETLNIFTILGIIMLIGLVAKNAILLVDFANQKIEEGFSVYDALIAANHARFRPIMMTTIAMVIAMVPIAFAQGDGSDMNRGLAIVIMGGLTSSLFLTLIIVPVVYAVFDGLGRRFRKGDKKVDYAEMMVADYDENDSYVSEINQPKEENEE